MIDDTLATLVEDITKLENENELLKEALRENEEDFKVLDDGLAALNEEILRLNDELVGREEAIDLLQASVLRLVNEQTLSLFESAAVQEVGTNATDELQTANDKLLVELERARFERDDAVSAIGIWQLNTQIQQAVNKTLNEKVKKLEQDLISVNAELASTKATLVADEDYILHLQDTYVFNR